MKNQLVAFVSSIVAALYTLFSNPQRVRLIVVAIAVCLVVAAALIPSLAILADGNIAIGGH